MIHDRHFTVAEANAALGWVRPRIETLRTARNRLGDREAHAALGDAAPTNGGGTHGKTIGQGFLEVRRILGELSAAGVLLRDLDRGLVDFPAMREGREVYLCWEFAEPRVGFWHELDAGFSGREPVD
ncbi:MAG: hypothetical protein QOJ01_1730 [Solirubrobacterales bacterium]|nr:hypothetical protein [Solirubrobacterales bacterium]